MFRHIEDTSSLQEPDGARSITETTMTVQPPRERGATIWLSTAGATDAHVLAEALAARLRALGRRAEALDPHAPRVHLVGRLLARNGVFAVAPTDGMDAGDEAGARHAVRVSVPAVSLDAGVERAMAALRAHELLPAL
jgi:hypothetical protein